MLRKQRNTLRYDTAENSLYKPVFHFNRIVTYRSIFFCVEVISSTLVLRKQRNTLRFATIRLKWKTGFTAFGIKFSKLKNNTRIFVDLTQRKNTTIVTKLSFWGRLYRKVVKVIYSYGTKLTTLYLTKKAVKSF